MIARSRTLIGGRLGSVPNYWISSNNLELERHQFVTEFQKDKGIVAFLERTALIFCIVIMASGQMVVNAGVPARETNSIYGSANRFGSAQSGEQREISQQRNMISFGGLLRIATFNNPSNFNLDNFPLWLAPALACIAIPFPSRKRRSRCALVIRMLSFYITLAGYM